MGGGEGGGEILMNLNREGCVRGMQQQLGNLENISEFFQFMKTKILSTCMEKPRKSGSITRKKKEVIALPYTMVSDFQKQKNIVF